MQSPSLVKSPSGEKHLEQRNMIKQKNVMKRELDKIDSILQAMASQKEQLLKTKLLIIQKIKQQLIDSGTESIYLDAIFNKDGTQKEGIIILPQEEKDHYNQNKDKYEESIMLQIAQKDNQDTTITPLNTQRQDINCPKKSDNLMEDEKKSDQNMDQLNMIKSQDNIQDNLQKSAQSSIYPIIMQANENNQPLEDQNTNNNIETQIENTVHSSNNSNIQQQINKIAECISETEDSLIQSKIIDNSSSIQETPTLDLRNKAFKSAPTRRQENNNGSLLYSKNNDNPDLLTQILRQTTPESYHPDMISSQNGDQDIRSKINKLISQAPCLQNQDLLKRSNFIKPDLRNQTLQIQHLVNSARNSKLEESRRYQTMQNQRNMSQMQQQGYNKNNKNGRQKQYHEKGLRYQSQSRDKVSFIPNQHHYHSNRSHSPLQNDQFNNKQYVQTSSQSLQYSQGNQIQSQLLINKDRRLVNNFNRQLPLTSQITPLVTDNKREIQLIGKETSHIDSNNTQNHSKSKSEAVNQVEYKSSAISKRLDLSLEISSNKVVSEILVNKESDPKSEIKDIQNIIPTNNIRIDHIRQKQTDQREDFVPKLVPPSQGQIYNQTTTHPKVIGQTNAATSQQVQVEIISSEESASQEEIIQQPSRIAGVFPKQTEDNNQNVLEISSESSLDAIKLAPDGLSQPLMSGERISNQKQTIPSHQLDQQENILIPRSSLNSSKLIDPIQIIDLSETTPQKIKLNAPNSSQRQNQFQKQQQDQQTIDADHQFPSPPISKDNQNSLVISISPQDQISNSGSTQPSQDEEEFSVEKRISQVEQRLIQFIREGVRNQEEVLKQALSLRAEMNLSKKQMAISQMWYISFSKRFNIEIE